MNRLAVLLVVSSCSRTTATGEGGAAPAVIPSSVIAASAPSASAFVVSSEGDAGSALSIDPKFEADVLAVSSNYQAMTRADGTWWAPEDCRAPIHPSFVSKATSGGHGRKMYTLFVKDFDAYRALTPDVKVPASPLGRPGPTPDRGKLGSFSQVIVKEAWTPIAADAPPDACDNHMSSYLAPVEMDGKKMRGCRLAGLFVMFEPKAREGTDAGWVYGTIQYERRAESPQVGQSWLTSRVTGAGKIANCMGCHTKAPHGRLFGLQAK